MLLRVKVHFEASFLMSSLSKSLWVLVLLLLEQLSYIHRAMSVLLLVSCHLAPPIFKEICLEVP